MSKKLRPEDLIGCNLTDKTYLDKDGYFLSSGSNNGYDLNKIFGKYSVVYSHSKKRDTVGFYIYYNDSVIGSVAYYKKYNPYYRCSYENSDSATRGEFLEKISSKNNDLFMWLIWNI